MALITYPAQVDAIKRWTQMGLCEKIGTWQQGRAYGDLWSGTGFGYRWSYETVGQHLVPGSFRVTCVGKS